MESPRIIESARKRGFSDADLLHVYRNPFRVIEQDDGMTMLIGYGASGADPLLEVGVVTADDGTQFIAHAMKARPKYLRH